MKKTVLVLLIGLMCISAFSGVKYIEKDKARDIFLSMIPSLELSDGTYNLMPHFYSKKDVWSVNSGKSGFYGQIDASTGEIIEFTHYDNKKVFPQLTKKEAMEYALKFIEKVSPEKLKNIVLYDDNAPLYVKNYYFKFMRKDIKVSDIYNSINDSIEIEINPSNGRIMRYSCYWSDIDKKILNRKFIDRKKAEEIYKNNIGLTYAIGAFYEQDGSKRYIPVYVSASQYGEYTFPGYIDAETGKVINMEGNEVKSGFNPVSYREIPKFISYNKLSKIMTKDEAEKAILALLKKVPEFSAIKTVSYTNYYEMNDKKWSLNLELKNKNGNFDKSCSVEIDAEYGIISGFYYNDTTIHSAKKITLDQAEKKAREIISVLNKDPDYKMISSGTSGNIYYINFMRVLNNGIFFYGDKATVRIEKSTGKVNDVSYYYSVSPVIEKADNRILLEEANKSANFDRNFDLVIIKMPDNGYKCVYTLIKNNFITLRADGVFIDGSMKEILNQTVLEETDREVKIMYDLNMINSKDIRELDKPATLRSILKMMYGLRANDYDRYDRNIYTNIFKTADDIRYFDFGAAEDIIDYNKDINPDKVLTKQETAELLGRYFGLKNYAANREVFAKVFTDENKINEKYYGYAVLLASNKTLDGLNGEFKPESTITNREVIKALFLSKK